MCRSRTARTNSGLVNVFGEEFGDEVLLRTLLGLRNQADYGKTELKASEATLRTYAVEAAAFVERCRAIVADAAASGADEPDPAPDL